MNNGGDYSIGLAIDGSGKAYVTGEARSWDFPTTPGAFQTNRQVTNRTSFIAKINPSVLGLPSLVYSTFLGGSGQSGWGDTIGNSIAVDSSGNAYVTGTTNAFNFPLVDPAQTFNNGLFLSINRGDQWAAINNGLTNPIISAIAIDANTTPRTLYVGTSINADVHTPGGIFKSNNGGTNWNAANSGLGNLNVRALVISPTTPSTLYVATDDGIFKSTNSGLCPQKAKPRFLLIRRLVFANLPPWLRIFSQPQRISHTFPRSTNDSARVC